MVLREKFKTYENALLILNLDSLQKRRQDMCLKFAKSGIENGKLNDLFQLKKRHKTSWG